MNEKLVLKADKNGFVRCPFCKEKHKHGIAGGNGHRVPDCTSSIIYNPVEGKHYRRNGYYVEFSPK